MGPHDLLSNQFYHSIVAHLSGTDLERCPGSEDICRLINVLATEENVDIRFYPDGEGVVYEYNPQVDLSSYETGLISLFTCFVEEYDDILLAVDEKIEDTFYQVLCDNL